jgi:hypothetical protein
MKENTQHCELQVLATILLRSPAAGPAGTARHPSARRQT